MIGNKYKYPNGNRIFKLVEKRLCTYHFECGHWVTDNVFVDLISVNQQLKLEL
jgi:hypothetical protein